MDSSPEELARLANITTIAHRIAIEAMLRSLTPAQQIAANGAMSELLEEFEASALNMALTDEQIAMVRDRVQHFQAAWPPPEVRAAMRGSTPPGNPR